MTKATHKPPTTSSEVCNILLTAMVASLMGSCNLICPEGDITLTNTSKYTVHRVLVDGTARAVLLPGESHTVSVKKGDYAIVFEDDHNSGGGCSEVFVAIKGCGYERIKCGL